MASKAAFARRYRPWSSGPRLIIVMPIGAFSKATRKCSSLAVSRAADSACSVTSIAVPQRWLTEPSGARRTSVQARMCRTDPSAWTTR